jgi:light-regulated signal transduction histidine kinase (bacteriophytochrome)
MLNILDDFGEERSRLEATERAVLNILDDATVEKLLQQDAQRAVLNVLEDFETEKARVEEANLALREAVAAAEAASRELEAFSYSVAHDLRAPLRSIDGFSQALVDDFGDTITGEGKTYLGFVRDSAQQMAQLIDDLLSLSRMSRAPLHRERVDLVVVAQSVLDGLRRGDPDRVVDVIVADELVAFGDPGLLRVVLENFLGNAWKFTAKREKARIELGQTRVAEASEFFVRDNGAGFDMAYSEKLFGVFQRLHPAREFEGSGIGLATAQRIIHRHGGRVWAQGEVDGGATFYFTVGETR